MIRNLSICLLTLLGTSHLMAEPAYLCQRTVTPIVIDGICDEETWALAKPVSPLRDLDALRPAFAQATIKMAYDDEYLYISAVLPERDIQATMTERDSIIYKDNNFEVFIDPTCTGSNYLELEINALNTVWDLFLTDSYRDNGIAIHDWDIKRLKTAISLQGTLNDASDEDRSWTVEIAWPWESITAHATLPREGRVPKAGELMRFNFSRVDHHPIVNAAGKSVIAEENSVWAPTGQVTIHTPELWGRVVFSGNPVGTDETFPADICMWIHGNSETVTPEFLAKWQAHGVNTVLIDGTVEAVDRAARVAKAQGLRTIAWVWALNRPEDAEALKHPQWYAVSADGKSCHVKEDRPFVGYYQFLCPTRPEVRKHLRNVVKRYAELESVDAIQLDYMRLPDVILPSGLWDKYKLDMSTELPPYDFCYCDHCKNAYRKAYGKDPVAGDPTWATFRLKAVAEVANTLIDESHRLAKPCGSAVFPTPSMSARMVRQDWSQFKLDFALPMVYASFYEADDDWTLQCVIDCQKETDNRMPLYPGIFLPDFDGIPPQDLIKRLLKQNPRGFAIFR